VLPLSIIEAVKIAVPEAFKYKVSALQLATGAIVSRTVTEATHVDVFPAASVAVNVTVFAPASAQVKIESVIVTVTEQLSLLPLSMSAATSLASPFVSKYIVAGLQSAIGLITSCIVTIAVQESTFPLASVPINVTVFAPRSAHVKVVCDKLSVTPLQLSILPLFTSAEVIVAIPDASKFTVTDWHVMLGAKVSSTVTVVVQVLDKPWESVAVRVTVLAPKSEQLKVV